MISSIIITRAGRPPARVMVVRRNGRRAGQVVRRMAAIGRPAWEICAVVRISRAVLARLLVAPLATGFWSPAMAAAIRREMEAA